MSFYNAILALCGGDLMPRSNTGFAILSLLLIAGAFYNAMIIGNLTMLAANLNRRSQKFQEKLDIANTSMKNMEIPMPIQ